MPNTGRVIIDSSGGYCAAAACRRACLLIELLRFKQVAYALDSFYSLLTFPLNPSVIVEA